MAWKDARKLIDVRRGRVARMHLRGLTQREIVSQLPTGDYPLVNPETGEPYALGTVNRDLQELRKQWRADAAADIAERKAEQLAELGELKRTGWGAREYTLVLRALEREAKLLGLDSPERHEVGVTGEVTIKGYATVSPDDWPDERPA